MKWNYTQFSRLYGLEVGLWPIKMIVGGTFVGMVEKNFHFVNIWGKSLGYLKNFFVLESAAGYPRTYQIPYQVSVLLDVGSITSLVKRDIIKFHKKSGIIFCFVLLCFILLTQGFFSLLPGTNYIRHYYSKQWQLTFNLVQVE